MASKFKKKKKKRDKDIQTDRKQLCASQCTDLTGNTMEKHSTGLLALQFIQVVDHNHFSGNHLKMTLYRSIIKRSSHNPYEHGILLSLVLASSVLSGNIGLTHPNLTQLLIFRSEHQKCPQCLHRPAGQAVLPQLPHQAVSLAGSQLLTKLSCL